MPSTPYDLVQDDQDLRIPLHAEQAFLNGITFQAKYIGSEEVSRPNTRAEIVQAMRRIRYDYKVRNEKKKKVTITVSVDGVKVLLKKRRRKKKQWNSEPEEFLYHPIYRIFYVSHDSSDLKIFSYIARDSSTDKFKCAVFKSNKKSHAMRIVRTVGQAFEVCHKFNLHKNSLDNNEERSDASSDLLDVERTSEQLSDEDLSKKEQIGVTPDLTPPQRPNHLELTSQMSSANQKISPCVLTTTTAGGGTTNTTTDEEKSPSSPTSPSREINKLKDQLEQQAMQTRQALAQLMLVREQLISETNARIEAQARTQQLLQQNRELLEHLASLGAYTDPQATTGLTSANIALAPQLSSTAKVARWFQQLPWHTASLSRPESGFVSGDSRSEKFHEDHNSAKDAEYDLCDEFLLVEGSSSIWTKMSAKKRRKLLGMRLGKVTTF